jgi:WD40 repeat protein
VQGDKFAKEPTVITTESGILCLVFVDQFGFLATGHEDAKGRQWSTKNGSTFGKQPVLVGHTGPVTAVTLVLEVLQNHIEPWLITASTDQSLKVWNVVAGTDRNTLRGHSGPITSMAMGRRYDHTLVTGSTDKTIKLWDPMREKERWMFLPGVAAVRAVAISSDSRTIAAAGDNGVARIYRSGREEPKSKSSP